MLRIKRFVDGEVVVLAVSGRIEDESLNQLESVFNAEQQTVVLDLQEVNLAGREAIKLLARCEAKGARLKNCPAYIREWITREQSGK